MCLVVPLLNQGSLITSIRGTNDVAWDAGRSSHSARHHCSA